MNSLLPVALYGAGCLILFIGERILGAGHNARTAVTGLGALLVAGAFLVRVVHLASAKGEARNALARLIPGYLLALGGLLVYAFGLRAGSTTESDWPVILKVVWPILWLTGTVAVGFMEFSLRSMAGSEQLEIRRLGDSGRAGLIVALAFSWLVALNYVATQRNVEWDARTIKELVPSDNALHVARIVSEEVTVSIFFPPANEVGEQVEAYFRRLAAANPLLKFERLDQEMVPARAKDLRARKNGMVVFSKGDARQYIELDDDAERARSKLKKLDSSVQEKLAKISQERKKAYFTIGHGERLTFPKAGDPPGMKDFAEALKSLNYEVENLGIQQGFSNGVPEDATLVVVAGPTSGFVEAEVNALIAYIQRGGSLILLFDPEIEHDPGLGRLTDLLGLEVDFTPLAHDQKYVEYAKSKTDRHVIFTNRSTAHDATRTLSKLGEKVATVFPKTGSIALKENMPPPAQGGPRTTITMRTFVGTWQDRDGDLEHTPGEEKKDIFQLTAAAELPAPEGSDKKHGGRALVAADADLLSDMMLRFSMGNQQWALDGLKWLEDTVDAPAEAPVPEDLPVMHTKDENRVWFYGTILGIPLAVLGLGALASRKVKAARGAA